MAFVLLLTCSSHRYPSRYRHAKLTRDGIPPPCHAVVRNETKRLIYLISRKFRATDLGPTSFRPAATLVRLASTIRHPDPPSSAGFFHLLRWGGSCYWVHALWPFWRRTWDKKPANVRI